MELKNKDLSRLRGEYKKIIDDLGILTKGLSGEQMNWKPSPEKWSIAECIDHLNATGEKYLEKVLPAIRNAEEKGITGNPGIKFGWFGKMLRMVGLEPPPKRKVSAPKIFRPRTTGGGKLDKDKVIRDFLLLQESLIKAVEDSDGLELNKVKFSNPASNLIKIRLGDFLDFTASHERRHIWQANNVKNAEGFPA